MGVGFPSQAPGQERWSSGPGTSWGCRAHPQQRGRFQGRLNRHREPVERPDLHAAGGSLGDTLRAQAPCPHQAQSSSSRSFCRGPGIHMACARVPKGGPGAFKYGPAGIFEQPELTPPELTQPRTRGLGCCRHSPAPQSSPVLPGGHRHCPVIRWQGAPPQEQEPEQFTPNVPSRHSAGGNGGSSATPAAPQPRSLPCPEAPAGPPEPRCLFQLQQRLLDTGSQGRGEGHRLDRSGGGQLEGEAARQVEATAGQDPGQCPGKGGHLVFFLPQRDLPRVRQCSLSHAGEGLHPPGDTGRLPSRGPSGTVLTHRADLGWDLGWEGIVARCSLHESQAEGLGSPTPLLSRSREQPHRALAPWWAQALPCEP